MVQYIPGPEATINPAINQIGEAIGKFINPFKDIQLGMYQAIMQKPELLQSFANMEHSNPGIMEKMGLGPVSNLIKSVGPDIKTQVEALYGPQMVKAQGQDITNKLALGNTQNEILSNPTTAIEVGRVSLGLPTTTQQKTQEHQEVVTGQEAKTAPAEADLKLQQVKVAREILSKFPNLKNINPVDIARHPEKYPEALSALMANPASAAMMGEVFTSERQKEYRSSQWDLAHFRYTNKDLMSQLIQRRAMEAFTNSGWKGSLDLWQKWISTPSIRERAQQLAQGAIKPTNENDQYLLDMAHYAANNQLIKYRVASDAASKSIAQTMVAINKGDLSTDQLAQKISAISSRLAEIKAAGGPDIRVKMGKENPLFPGPSKYPVFYDPKKPNEPLDIETINGMIENVDPASFISKAKEYTPGAESATTPSATTATSISTVDDAVNAIAGASDPKAAFDKMVGDVEDPQTIITIRQRLIEKGIDINGR